MAISGSTSSPSYQSTSSCTLSASRRTRSTSPRRYKESKQQLQQKHSGTHLSPISFLFAEIARCLSRACALPQNPTIVNFPVKNLEMGNYTTTQSSQKYNLMASLQHDGTPEAGSYRAFVHFRANDQWYEVQDLHVNGVHPQLISVSESYIQVWRMVED